MRLSASPAMFEPLEQRRLLSGTICDAAATSAATPTVAAAVIHPAVVHPAVIHPAVSKALRPAQVLGTYTGSAHVKALFVSVKVPVTLTVKASGSQYAGKLTVKGYGSYPFTVTSAQLLKLREGTMTVPFNRSGEKGTVTVTIGKNAKTASGSFSVSGTVGGTGTFDLTKTA